MYNNEDELEENVEENGEENAESNYMLNNGMYGGSSPVFSSDFNSELYGGLNIESNDEPKDEGPRWIPRRIIIGSVIVCLGIAVLLYIFNLFHVKDVLWFLPFVLIITGLLRIWKKGFFNGLAQFLIIGGLQLHLAFLGYRIVLDLGLPLLVIWIGILVVVKGFLPYKGYPKYRHYSDFKVLLQQKQNDDTDVSSAEPENEEQIQ